MIEPLIIGLCLLNTLGFGFLTFNNWQPSQEPNSGLIFKVNVDANSSVSTQPVVSYETDDTRRPYSYTPSLLQRIGKHKTKLFCAAVAAGYGYCVYRIKQMEQHLSSPQAWNNWYGSLDFEQLCVLPQEQLAKELLLAVQAQYTSSSDLDDFMQPCAQFLDDIDAELAELKQYQTWTQRLQRCYATRFFFIDRILAQSVSAKINRLAYLKNVFLTWVAHYKVEANNRHVGMLSALMEAQSSCSCQQHA